MLKKLIDTNIFIDRFYRPEIHRDIFLSEGVVYLSSVALMELRAGAHAPEAVKAVKELTDFFRRVDRIIVPSLRDYERAGEMLARLQSVKGYDLKKTPPSPMIVCWRPRPAAWGRCFLPKTKKTSRPSARFLILR